MKRSNLTDRDEYYFEYDNVYNMEEDERRYESGLDSSVWFS